MTEYQRVRALFTNYKHSAWQAVEFENRAREKPNAINVEQSHKAEEMAYNAFTALVVEIVDARLKLER